MGYKDEKKLPADDADGVLQDNGGWLYENGFTDLPVECQVIKQFEPCIHSLCIDDDQNNHHPDEFCHDACIGCTIESKFRHPKVAKNQSIIQHHIGNCFCQGTPDQQFALIGSYQQGIAHLVDV